MKTHRLMGGGSGARIGSGLTYSLPSAETCGYKVRPDLCATNCTRSPKEFCGKFYTDSLVHDPNALRMLLDVIGKV